jgi:hypothetical protein
MAIYEFYKDYCVCPGQQIYIGMRDLDGVEVGAFPVYVYNVNEEILSIAYTKQQYIDIWNSDPDNRAVGTLSGLIGPFSFTLTLKPGQTAPAYVIGDIDGAVPEYSLTDSDGVSLADSDGAVLLYQ